jgi:hypothetical protein
LKEANINQPWLRDLTLREALFIVLKKRVKTVADLIDSVTDFEVLIEISS